MRGDDGYGNVAVLIPCLDEERTIGKVVSDFRRALPGAAVYVYDNASTDGTARVASEAGALVRREPRRGKGNVVRAMLADIDADAYVLVDGDDTYPADAAPEMVRMVLDGDADMVIGDRLSSTYFTENKRPFHNLGNRLVRDSINRLFGADVHDIMTGYRVLSFTFAKTCPVMSRGFELETEMTIHSLNNNMRIREVPVMYRDRPDGSVSKLDTFGDGARVLNTIFRLIREYRPLPFFGGLGSAIAAIGLALCMMVAVEFAKTGMVARFPTLIGAVMLVVAGIVLAVAGIVLDVMARNDRRSIQAQERLYSYLRRVDAVNGDGRRPSGTRRHGTRTRRSTGNARRTVSRRRR